MLYFLVNLSDIYENCQTFMTNCQVFMTTCQIFMSTCPSLLRKNWHHINVTKCLSTSVSSSYLIYKIYLNRDTLYISHLPLNYIPTMVISSLPTMHRFTLNSLSPFTHTHKGVNLSTNQNAPHDFMMSTSRHNQNFFCFT